MEPLSSALDVARRISAVGGHLGAPSPSRELAEQPPHPLDPLTATEIVAASKACRAHASAIGLPYSSLRFNAIGPKVGGVVLTMHSSICRFLRDWACTPW
jgi:nucleoside-diphosphate-sugar epimerase